MIKIDSYICSFRQYRHSYHFQCNHFQQTHYRHLACKLFAILRLWTPSSLHLPKLMVRYILVVSLVSALWSYREHLNIPFNPSFRPSSEFEPFVSARDNITSVPIEFKLFWALIHHLRRNVTKPISRIRIFVGLKFGFTYFSTFSEIHPYRMPYELRKIKKSVTSMNSQLPPSKHCDLGGVFPFGAIKWGSYHFFELEIYVR